MTTNFGGCHQALVDFIHRHLVRNVIMPISPKTKKPGSIELSGFQTQ